MPSSYLPALGGVEELTRHLALTLEEAGDVVEVWVGTADAGGSPSVEELDGIVVRRLPYPLPARRLASMVRLATHLPVAVSSIRHAARTFRPDVIHVQCFGPNGIYATGLSRLSGIPLVVTLQGETVMDDYDVFDNSRIMRRGLVRGLARADAVTACSAFTLRDAEMRFGLPPGKGEVVFNGVETGESTGVHSASRPPQVGEGRYVFALGRVVEKKGFDLLIRAFADVAPDHDVDLVIGGTGAATGELMRLVTELRLEGRVRFCGRLTRHEVAGAMSHAEALVVPSRLEPFGIVVLEGWRAGVAVIATSIGGPPEFVTDGQDGLLVDPFDTGALARALRKVLADDSARERMARAGLAKVEEFAWPRVADRYRACYEKVKDGASVGGRSSALGRR